MIAPFIISAIMVMYFDSKYKEIPLWLILYNYLCLVLLTDPIFGFGFVFILICYKFNFTIDVIYIIILLCLLLNGANATGLIFLLLNIIFSKDQKISFMFGLESALILSFL